MAAPSGAGRAGTITTETAASYWLVRDQDRKDTTELPTTGAA